MSQGNRRTSRLRLLETRTRRKEICNLHKRLGRNLPLGTRLAGKLHVNRHRRHILNWGTLCCACGQGTGQASVQTLAACHSFATRAGLQYRSLVHSFFGHKQVRPFFCPDVRVWARCFLRVIFGTFCRCNVIFFSCFMRSLL